MNLKISINLQCAGPDGGGTGPPLRRHKTTKQLVVNNAMTASPVETVTKLITRGRELLSESDHPESNKSSRIHCGRSLGVQHPVG